MDQNTTWGEVKDFSWYTSDRLNSLHGLHLVGKMGYELGVIHANGGVAQALHALKGMALPDVYRQFFYEALTPKESAKYAPKTRVGDIRACLTSSSVYTNYFGYDGYILDRSMQINGLQLQINSRATWIGQYKSRLSEKNIKEVYGSTGSVNPYNDGEWSSFVFRDDEDTAVFLFADKFGEGGTGNIFDVTSGPAATKEDVLGAFQAAVLTEWDPIFDIHSSVEREGNLIGQNLSAIRKNLAGSGIQSVRKDALVMANGGEVKIGKLSFEKDQGSPAARPGFYGGDEAKTIWKPVIKVEGASGLEVNRVAILASVLGQKIR